MINSSFSIQTGSGQMYSLRDFAARSSRRRAGEKGVHLIRAIGAPSGLPEELKEIDRQLDRRMEQEYGSYLRLNGLPNLGSSADILYYSMSLEEWQQNGCTSVVIHSSEKNPGLAELLGHVLRQCGDHFRRVTPSVTDSMERNFLVKLLFWADHTVKHYSYDGNGLCGSLIYRANGKKQEYLFGWFMAMTGLDVLMLLPEGDGGLPAALRLLSDRWELGACGTVALPEYIRSRPSALTQDSRMNSSPKASAIPGEKHSGAKNNTPNEVEHSRPHIPISAIRRPDRDRQARGSQSGQTPGTIQAPELQRLPARRELTFEELALLASSVVLISIHDPRGQVIGSGSGIMVGRDGYILTNNHVARGGSSYSVRIEEDDRLYTTDQVVKYHPLWDLALIRIDRTLQPLPIYRGEKPLVRGQKVVAIGSPLGFFNSISDGIISGFREIDQVDMIQFTAPISRGSSGGAVLNMYGEVIGISTAGIDDGQNINLAMGYECIRSFAGGFLTR